MDQSFAVDCSDIRDDDGADPLPTTDDIVDMLAGILADGLDHPEIWPQVVAFAAQVPDLIHALQRRLAVETDRAHQIHLCVLASLCQAERNLDAAIQLIEPLGIRASQSALVQGAIFYLHGLRDPENPKYQLEGKICKNPFTRLDVLENSSHLCCASWLQQSVGNMSSSDWQDVWNSKAAQDIRASMLDGSFRYCNKIACPTIQTQELDDVAEMAVRSDLWRDIVEQSVTALPVGPEEVNLAYDKTCNLSCPSCRTEKIAADEATRARYEELQERNILPMLRDSKLVVVTGSGDPFASKNFRKLMTQLTVDDYPELKFLIMTNGMLLTPRQWEAFPSLHGRVHLLKLSIDAATGPTHELLRRGARWPVMLENMAFIGKLVEQRLIDLYELVFTVQYDNYKEMADAVDLARSVGASRICFSRMTNWGTFTDEDYASKAVFTPSHPAYPDFIEHMRDPRLRDPIVMLGDLQEFLPEEIAKKPLLN